MPLFKRSGYWQDVSPRGAIADLVTVFRQAGDNRWRIAALAAACTFAIFSMIWHEGGKGPPRPPKITFIRTFAADRPDAQIAASNLANQHVQDALAAAQARRDEEVRHIYKTIGRASGMDVDAIDAKARAEDKAQRDAERRRLQAELAAERAATGASPAAR